MFLNRTLVPYFMEFLNLDLITFSSINNEYIFYLKTYFKIYRKTFFKRYNYFEYSCSCVEEYFYKACYLNNKDLVLFFISLGVNDWDMGMVWSTRGGHKDLVLFFIEKGANNWNWGMVYAASGDYKELVLFFIEKGTNDWSWGIDYASANGNENLVDFFKSKIVRS